MPRTLIVSNRLPTKVLRTDDGLTFQPSEGGLATGLGSIYKQGDNVWIGWPGLFLEDAAEEDYIRQKLRADNMAPVVLTEAEIRDFYEGFSNSTLWPTFHYFSEFATYEQAHWEAYVVVNEKFCAAVLAQAGPEGCRTTSCCCCRPCCARRGPRRRLAFFCTFRFPRTS